MTIATDSDVEFILQLYDTTFRFLTDKQKLDFAESFLYKLVDYGFDVKANAQEIGEHDEYLDKAVEKVLEEDDWDPEEQWLDEEYEEWED
jgi:hypothetical protein